MKRVNGSGSVIRHGGARRRPWEARITTGWDASGRQQCRSVGWYATRDEAQAALAAYNTSPYDVDARRVTLATLFERWLSRATQQAHLSPLSLSALKSSYRHCGDLCDIPFASIRAHHIQGVIDNCGHGHSTQNAIKNLFYNLDRYAEELDIVAKGYSHLVHVAPPSPKIKTIFSDAEVSRLWENIKLPFADTVLILLYSGWRISELLTLRKEDVAVDGVDVPTMTGGVKTAAGKNRVVPIHSAILPLVKSRHAGCNAKLVEHNGSPISEVTYRRMWKNIMDTIGAKHTPHDCRHTFRTWLDSTPALLSCINKIMGHVCSDLGLERYTHKTLETLRDTVELIKTENLQSAKTYTVSSK